MSAVMTMVVTTTSDMNGKLDRVDEGTQTTRQDEVKVFGKRKEGRSNQKEGTSNNTSV
jgi:hypothetical protein